MEGFAALLEGLQRASSEAATHRWLCRYFGQVEGADGAWAVALLRGRRLKRVWTQAELMERARETVAWPAWLVDLSHEHVGDVAETAALLFDAASAGGGAAGEASLAEVIAALEVLREGPAPLLEAWVKGWWRCLDARCGYVVNRLLLGGIRKCVEPWQVEAALAEVTGVSREVIALRLTRGVACDDAGWRALTSEVSVSEAAHLPEPFAVVEVYDEGDLEEALGEPGEWLMEWQEDGLRVQVLKVDGGLRVWSEDGRALGSKLPELVEVMSAALPEGCAVEAWLCATRGGERLALPELERRLGRKRVDAKLIEAVGVELLALDLRRLDGRPPEGGLSERRAWLGERLEGWREAGAPIRWPHRVQARTWSALVYRLARGRGHTGCAGVSLRCQGAGEIFARWWVLEAAPMAVRAVMLYAELAGRGGRDLSGATLAVWGERGRLVSLGKARLELPATEREAVRAWVKENTRQRYGPVRSVRPGLVFELSFDGVYPSKRSKAGVSLQEPRVTRWFPEMRLSSVDSLASVLQGLP